MLKISRGGGGSNKQTTKIDVVYHLAAHYVPNYKHEDIKDFIDSNIVFGVEVLEAMKTFGIKNFVNTGTYWQHYQNADYNPVDIYAATKQSFEDILRFYQETADFKVISLHLFDNYGSNDKRRKIINLFKDISESGEHLKVSPGEQLVDVVHVDDIVEAFVTAGNYLRDGRYEFCGTYGVSSGHPITLREVAATFEKVIGRKLPIEWGGRPYRKREVMVPWNTFKTLPGWKPKTDFEKGIRELCGAT